MYITILGTQYPQKIPTSALRVKQYVAPYQWQLVGLSYGRAAARIII